MIGLVKELMTKNDFKLYQHREVGFGAHFQIVLCLIDYCLSNNIKCEIDIRNLNYSNQNQNTWELIFEQPFSNVIPQTIISDQFSELTDFTEFWNLGYDSKDRKKYCDFKFIEKYKTICKKYIKINPFILNEVKNFCLKLKNKKILGVHKRGRDHLTIGHASNQSHLLKTENIFLFIDKEIDNYDYIFLTSDEYSVYTDFFKKYQNKLLIYDNKSEYNYDHSIGIHTLRKNDEEKIKSLKNLFIEILILSKCDKMFLMNSNVSHISLFFSEHYNYEFYDKHLTYQ